MRLLPCVHIGQMPYMQEGKLQILRLPPDFLSGLVASVDFMPQRKPHTLSMRAAY